jgi:Rad3-related DNA helicase
MENQTLEANFPHDEIRGVQGKALEFIAKHPDGCILEIPTGTGKTAIAWAALRAAEAEGQKGLVYITPTKMQAEQIMQGYAKRGNKIALTVLGRAEYECLYYTDLGQEVNAEQSPCYVLDCDHRVNQETGETEDPEEDPCPYYLAKFQAKQALTSGGIVVTTTAFYIMNRMLVSGWREAAISLQVIDEAHRMAPIARSVFDQTVTDWHLKRVADIVRDISEKDADALLEFYKAFMRMVLPQASQEAKLLKDEELQKLVDLLKDIDSGRIEKGIRQAIRSGKIDPAADRDALRVLTGFIPGVRRLIRSLEFSMESKTHRPLNYVVAYHYKKDDPDFADSKKKARFFLTVKNYYVAPVLKKAFAGPAILLSATIGDPVIFGHESGMTQPFLSLPSSFASDKTRIFRPIDMPDMSYAKQERDTLKNVLRDIARAAKRFADAGHRSLVVVVSDEEKQKFAARAELEKLKVVTYGGDVTAKVAAKRFKDGEGDCLLGTVAQYGEGVDLPSQIAPVIFFLRPSFPSPSDPLAQFEEKRFGRSKWGIWRYRAVLQALQVRGRNVRSADDVGVCFFISAQFREFLMGSLPEWLKPAYQGQRTFEQNIQETLKLLA